MATNDGLLIWMWLALVMATRVGTGFVMLSPRPELVVMEGQTAMFTCSPLYSVALPILERNGAIYYDPIRLTYSDHAPNTPQGYRVYQLRDVERVESGSTLRCYMGGFFSNTITLSVVVPPTVTGSSGQLTLFESDHTHHTLHYTVRGFPYPHTLLWLRDGSLFTGNDRVGVVSNTTLLIQNALRGDSGNYTLVAVNVAGHTSLSLLLRVVYNEFLESPTNVTVTTGGLVKLRCVHRFGWAYAWFSDFGPLYQHTDKTQLSDGGHSLTYGPVDYTDHELRVRCVVHVRGTDQLYTSPPATLTVHSSPVVIAPPPTLVREGSDVQLLFLIRGHPPPTHTHYLHNGHTLTDERVHVGGLGWLYISNVTTLNAGNYTLNVSNGLGHASNTTTLDVLYAPVIAPISYPIITQVLKMVSLPCGLSYHSNPPSQVVWKRVTFDLSSDPRFTTEGDILILSSPTHSDQGVYVCTVSNSLGTRSTSITLLVLEPPTQPVNVRLVTVGPSWAVLTWDTPHTNGSRPVNGYMVTVTPAIGEDVDVSTAPSPDCVEVACVPVQLRVEERVVNVSGLVPGVEHVMVVKALSGDSALHSPPSEQLNFTTNKSVPAVVGVSAVVSGWGESLVRWHLAHSGGSPVTHFHIQFQRANDSYWRDVTLTPSRLSQFDVHANITQIPPGQRSWRVHGLESAVLYHFRVRGVSVEGVGAYVSTQVPVLSHEMGVPSRPSRPRITCWTNGGMCVHSELSGRGPVDVLVLVCVGGLLNSTHTFTNHTSDSILLSNVSYHGDLSVQVVLANEVGLSEPSQPSLSAREFVRDLPVVSGMAGVAVGVLVGFVNTVTVMVSMVICGQLCWDVDRRKRSLNRRETTQPSDSPISPRMMFLGNLRQSPDTASSNELPPGVGPRKLATTATLTPPTPLSSVSMV